MKNKIKIPKRFPPTITGIIIVIIVAAIGVGAFLLHKYYTEQEGEAIEKEFESSDEILKESIVPITEKEQEPESINLEEEPSSFQTPAPEPEPEPIVEPEPEPEPQPEPEPEPEETPQPEPQEEPPSCQDECSKEGEIQCLDDINKKTCGNYDDDSCLEWSDSQSCETDTSCGYGNCGQFQQPHWSCVEGQCKYICVDEPFCILPNVPPVVGEVDPSSGESSASEEVIFTTTVSDPNGWKDISETMFFIGSDLSSRIYSFYAKYNQNNNKLYMRNDVDSSWETGYLVGSNNIIENSYAQIDASKTTVSGQGGTLTVNWAVTFKSSFAGKTYKTYLYVKDDTGLFPEWEKRGQWTVNE